MHKVHVKVDYDTPLRPDGVWKTSHDVLVASGKKTDGGAK